MIDSTENLSKDVMTEVDNCLFINLNNSYQVQNAASYGKSDKNQIENVVTTEITVQLDYQNMYDEAYKNCMKNQTCWEQLSEFDDLESMYKTIMTFYN